MNNRGDPAGDGPTHRFKRGKGNGTLIHITFGTVLVREGDGSWGIAWGVVEEVERKKR